MAADMLADAVEESERTQDAIALGNLDIVAGAAGMVLGHRVVVVVGMEELVAEGAAAGVLVVVAVE